MTRRARPDIADSPEKHVQLHRAGVVPTGDGTAPSSAPAATAFRWSPTEGPVDAVFA